MHGPRHAEGMKSSQNMGGAWCGGGGELESGLWVPALMMTSSGLPLPMDQMAASPGMVKGCGKFKVN